MTKRLYISADIEGVAGVVSKSQTGPSGFEYADARRWMTDEVNAVVDAAKENGIDEVVVSDSHGNAQNLLPSDLRPGVQLIRGWPRPLGMMQGIEFGSFVGAVFVGYHTGARATQGVLPHTNTGAFCDVRINGESASETLLNAGVAAQYGVPLIMVSGDDAYTTYAKHRFPQVEAAVVKWSYGSNSARTLLPQDACEVIRNTATRALTQVGYHPVEVIEGPIEVELDLTNRKSTELIAYLRMFERVSATSIRFEADDICEVVQTLRFLAKAATLQ